MWERVARMFETPWLPSWSAFLALIRWHKPIGTLLLLGPTWAALWAASASSGEPLTSFVFLVFTAGACVMRSLGCVVNDWADRHWDGAVARTKDRPLVSGVMHPKQALVSALILACVALGLVCQLPLVTLLWSCVALSLAVVYPFTKRWCDMPQVFLGAAYGMSVILAYAAVTRATPLEAWLLWAVTALWMVASDTAYGWVDAEDDARVGIRSLSRTLGPRHLRSGIAACQTGVLLGWLVWGLWVGSSLWFLVIWCCMLLDVAYQQHLLGCDRAFDMFRHNVWLSLMMPLLSVLAFV